MTVHVPTPEFVAAWHESGSKPAEVARITGLDIRGVYARRLRLEAEGYELPTRPNHHAARQNPAFAYRPRIDLALENGRAIVWNDRHVWPTDGVSEAEAALLCLIPRLRPDVLVCNGDVFDGARLSRHDPLGWEDKPTTADELAAVQAHMHRIVEAASAWSPRLIRTVGNHCMRFDRHLAKEAGDLKGIHGFRLSDHLPAWEECWSAHINAGIPAGHTVVKHRLRQGIHASYNNATIGGVTVVTGHTHKQDVRAVTNYSGTHWGVQTGMLADRAAVATEYAEDHPDPGQPGFAVLTWRDGVLQPPELATTDTAGVTWFRGHPIALRFRMRAGSAPHVG